MMIPGNRLGLFEIIAALGEGGMGGGRLGRHPVIG